MIKISGVSKSFSEKMVLKDVTLNIEEGEIFGIIGHSGAGKSTLLRCLNGLESYDTGSIQVMDGAKIPQRPIKPNKTLNVAIAFFIGLVASLGLTFALEYMDSTLKTEENINRYLDIPVIGIIPRDNN